MVSNIHRLGRLLSLGLALAIPPVVSCRFEEDVTGEPPSGAPGAGGRATGGAPRGGVSGPSAGGESASEGGTSGSTPGSSGAGGEASGGERAPGGDGGSAGQPATTAGQGGASAGQPATTAGQGGTSDETPPPGCENALSIPLNSMGAYPPEAPPLCELLAGGAGKMTFTLPTCGDGSYAACDFASGVNLNGFDADNGAGGVLEIEFCTDHAIQGELNLWYGAFPTRKKLELLGPAETMEPGCRIVRRSPEQANCHWTSRPEYAGDCTLQGVGTDLACARCGGRCNEGCDIEFPSTKLTLIAENCLQPFGQAVGVELRAVRLLPRECVCASDEPCAGSPERTKCIGGLFSSALCPDGSEICGVCAEEATCLAKDEECVVLVAGRECPGVIRCKGSTSSCEPTEQECLSE